jgi:hypothetical protein
MTDTHTFTVRLTQTEKDVPDALKAQGIQKGNWVAQAIREKMERDGLLDLQEKEGGIGETKDQGVVVSLQDRIDRIMK